MRRSAKQRGAKQLDATRCRLSSTRRTPLCAPPAPEQFTLGAVAGHLRRTGEFRRRFAVAADAGEQVPAHGREQVILRQRVVLGEFVHDREACLRTVRHGHGYGAVQRDDRGRQLRDERRVEACDRRPVGLLRRHRPRMAGRDGRLQQVRAGGTSVRAGQVLASRQCGETASDEQLVPASSVLLAQQHDAAVRRCAGDESGGLDLQQRGEAVYL